MLDWPPPPESPLPQVIPEAQSTCPLPGPLFGTKGVYMEFFGHCSLFSHSWGSTELPTHPGPGWDPCCPSLFCAPSSQKSTMESKDEVSDTDSGIILQSGEWVGEIPLPQPLAQL